jgi:lipoyl-dependent peroxiredoxin
MAIRKAEAIWNGTLKEGSGTFKGGSGALAGGYTYKTRFEEDQSQTNPEELIGAAHAGPSPLLPSWTSVVMTRGR